MNSTKNTYQNLIYSQKHLRPVFMLFIVTFVTRLILFLYLSPSPEKFFLDDSDTYTRIANNLIDNHAFSKYESPPFKPNDTRVPAYPFFVAFVYLLFRNQAITA